MGVSELLMFTKCLFLSLCFDRLLTTPSTPPINPYFKNKRSVLTT